MQSYGSKWLDGSLLLIPTTGFLPLDDPRIAGTVRAVEGRLLADGFVMRHDPAEVETGLAHGEGAFLACSFWLADAYVLLGRHEDAQRCSRACSSCATMSACSRRNTTSAPGGWWATFRRPSPTSRWSTRPTISPGQASRPSSARERRSQERETGGNTSGSGYWTALSRAADDRSSSIGGRAHLPHRSHQWTAKKGGGLERKTPNRHTALTKAQCGFVLGRCATRRYSPVCAR